MKANNTLGAMFSVCFMKPTDYCPNNTCPFMDWNSDDTGALLSSFPIDSRSPVLVTLIQSFFFVQSSSKSVKGCF